MKELINDLITARSRQAQLAKARAQLVTEWETVNRELFTDVKAAVAEVERLETLIKDHAVAEFRRTGNKRPAPGVEVKEFTEIAYVPKDAYEWALEHKVALQLDRRSFENIMLDMAERPSFIGISKRPKGTIAANLVKAQETPVSLAGTPASLVDTPASLAGTPASLAGTPVPLTGASNP